MASYAVLSLLSELAGHPLCTGLSQGAVSIVYQPTGASSFCPTAWEILMAALLPRAEISAAAGFGCVPSSPEPVSKTAAFWYYTVGEDKK